jgi:hypothetical protein
LFWLASESCVGGIIIRLHKIPICRDGQAESKAIGAEAGPAILGADAAPPVAVIAETWRWCGARQHLDAAELVIGDVDRAAVARAPIRVTRG